MYFKSVASSLATSALPRLFDPNNYCVECQMSLYKDILVQNTLNSSTCASSQYFCDAKRVASKLSFDQAPPVINNSYSSRVPVLIGDDSILAAPLHYHLDSQDEIDSSSLDRVVFYQTTGPQPQLRLGMTPALTALALTGPGFDPVTLEPLSKRPQSPTVVSTTRKSSFTTPTDLTGCDPSSQIEFLRNTIKTRLRQLSTLPPALTCSGSANPCPNGYLFDMYNLTVMSNELDVELTIRSVSPRTITILDHIVEQMCDPKKCTSCNQLYETVRSYIINHPDYYDLPIRTKEWLKTHSSTVKTTSVGFTCTGPRLHDLRFLNTNRADYPDTYSPNMITNLISVVECSLRDLSLSHLMTKREKAKLNSDVRSNPLVTIALYSKDHELVPDNSFFGFIHALYSLRSKLGISANYGRKSEFHSQGPTESLDVLSLTESSFFSKVLSFLSLDTLTSPDPFVAISKALTSIWNSLTSFFCLVSDTITSLCSAIKDKVVNMMTSLLISRLFSGKWTQANLKKIVITSAIILLSLLCVGTFLQYSVLISLIYMLVPKEHQTCEGCYLAHVPDLLHPVANSTVYHYCDKNYAFGCDAESPKYQFFAQGTPATASTLSVVMSIVIGIIGLNKTSSTTVRNFCLTLTAIFAGGSVMANSASALFMALPATLRLALIHKFGTSEQVASADLDIWLTRSNALLTASRIPSVVSSEFYYNEISLALTTARKIVVDLPPQHRSQFSATFQRLLTVSIIVAQFRHDAQQRIVPFAIHLCGEAGTGKSTTASTILRESCDFTSRDTFSRMPSDEFWSGYLAQKAVIIDEFLVGDATRRETLALEYLGLISCTPYKPPLPSIDSISTGLKGTSAQIDVVITMNNVVHDVCPHVNTTALQRRRNLVIQIRHKSDAHHTPGSKARINMKAYSKAEKANAAWAEFRFCPPEFSVDWENRASPWMSLSDMLPLIKDQYETHLTTSKSLQSALNGKDLSESTPQEIFQSILADMYQVPNHPVSISTAVIDLLSSTKAKAQGPRRTHVHNCCPAAYRHANYIKSFLCKSCFRRTNCTNCPSAQEYDNKVSSLTSSSDEAAYRSFSAPDPGNDTDEDAQSIALDSATADELLAPIVKNQDRVPLYFDYINVKGMESMFFKGIIAASVSLIAFAYGVMKYLQKSTPEEVTFRQVHAQSARPGKTSRRPARLIKFSKGAREYSAQSDDTPSCVFIIDGREFLGVPVKDKWIMTYHHSLFDSKGKLLPDNSPMTLRYEGKDYPSLLNVSTARVSIDLDLAFLWVESKTLPNFRNITSKFLPESTLNSIETTSVKLKLQKGYGYSHARPLYNVQYDFHSNFDMQLDKVWIYDIPTVEGDCGAPLVIATGIYAGKIIGLHVAGTGVTSKVPVAKGLSTIVSKESIDLALSDDIPLDDLDFFPQGPQFVNDQTVNELRLLPNCREIKLVEPHEIIHLTRKTKLAPSLLHGELSVKPEKVLPILSPTDPRANGIDPVLNSIKDVLSTTHPEVNVPILESVFETMLDNYVEQLQFKAGYRQLTFEEACKGLPSLLTSINTATSVGFPLTLQTSKKGKTDHIWFDEKGEFHYTSEFRALVDSKLAEMQEYDWHQCDTDARFVGYLKDETISPAKAQEVRTRMIFANDLVACTAFRMHFGAVLTAFNNSHSTTPLAIGMNQYSYDMQSVYNYLSPVGTRFIAGDYKSFDKRMHPLFRFYAYQIIFHLARLCGVPYKVMVYLYVHEVNAFAQVLNVMFRTNGNHFSGNFWTTILNCLVNELYFRYIFKVQFPHHLYDEHVRGKFLGDDHVLCVSDDCVSFHPIRIAELMATIGQTYTSANKNEPLTDQFISFDKVTFLGAHPRMLHGSWTGAMKKVTLYECIQFTRDSNLSLQDTALQMIHCASQWDQAFFTEYSREITAACSPHFALEFPSWKELSRTVANRTSGTGYRFHGYSAQSKKEAITPDAIDKMLTFFLSKAILDPLIPLMDEKSRTRINQQIEDSKAMSTQAGQDYFKNWLSAQTTATRLLFKAQGPPMKAKASTASTAIAQTRGLTKITAAIFDNTSNEQTPSLDGIANLALNDSRADLSLGPDTRMPRSQYSWVSSQGRGTNIAIVRLPYDVLALGNPDNIQNMPFQRLIYLKLGVELTFQITGQPATQGLLAIYFVPLQEPGGQVSVSNYLQYTHILLNPNTNTTATLTVPFEYWRSALNSYAGGMGEEAFGSVRMSVLSPLKNPAGASVVISMFSRFTDSAFTIPRPIPDTNAMDLTRKANVPTGYLQVAPESFIAQGPAYFAQGPSYSKIENNTTISGSTIAGNVAPEHSTSQSHEHTNETSTDLSIPMDKPGLVSGGVPTFHTYSGMSKCVGYNPSVGLHYHPEETHREPDTLFDASEMFFENIFARKGIIGFQNWTNADAIGTELLNLPLNSVLSFPTGFEGRTYPANIALLNEFQFWHADIHFDFIVVKNQFQSGRLLATVAYGAPTLLPEHRNIFKNTTLDLTSESQIASLVVPYNSGTQFLNTYGGPFAPNTVQDYSLGTIMLTVQNQLNVTSELSEPSVEIIICVSFHNVHVYESRPSPLFVNNVRQIPPLVSPIPPEAPAVTPRFLAQGPSDEEGLVQVTAPDATAEETTAVELTEHESPDIPEVPCRINSGAKFEFTLTTVTDVIRRYIRINPTLLSSIGNQQRTVWRFPVFPEHRLTAFYACWSGKLNYRIYVNTVEPVVVRFIPFSHNTALPDINITSMLGSVGQYRVNDAGQPFTVTTVPGFDPSMPSEVLYPSSGHVAFIDVQTPFTTIYNFLSTYPVNQPLYGVFHNSPGYIVMETGADVGIGDFTIFQAGADDFRLAIYRPPISSTLSPFTHTLPAGTGPFAFGNFYTNIT